VSGMNSKLGATRKIVMMDWAGSPDRSQASVASAWHSDGGQGVFNILYGDNHVDNYVFKPAERAVNIPGGTVAFGEGANPAKRNYW